MAIQDQNTGLPIRSEADGADERLHSKLVDFADPSGVDKQAQISEKLLHTRQHGQDPADAAVQQRLSETGETAVDGVYDGTNNSNPANIGIVACSHDASPADTQQTLRVTATSNIAGDVRALDVALRDENGAPFSASNPLPTTSVDSEGTEINSYNDNSGADVAAAASMNHDYTVTALTTLKLSSIWASASGKIKIVVQVETGVATGVFTTKFTAFNSTANPNISLPIGESISVAAGVRVRLVKTNKDNQPMGIYSTISGHEIA